MSKTSLSTESIAPFRASLREANLAFAKANPGSSPARQTVHTLYGGAHLFHADAAAKMSHAALETLREHAPGPRELARAVGSDLDPALWEKIYPRVVDKLKREAVEDLRVDFEDGYGNRPDAEEDGHAQSVAQEMARGMNERSLPPFIGIRIKPFNEENVTRSLRTLDLFLTTLLEAAGGKLPDGFVVTLPKITHAEQSRFLAQVLRAIEKRNHLPERTLRFEIMVETTQAVLDAEGYIPLRSFIDASGGRCIGAHFGTYDYTASCGITAAYQAMDNPVCDFAKHAMQVALAGTPILLSDGATNIMPVGSTETVHHAWRLSYGHIRHSLRTGFYQGWDLHPAQLPVRFAAIYAFFMESLAPASQRLHAFMEKAARATLLGDVFDDAATGQGLLNFFLRGMACGAITEQEALATGLTLEEFRGRSFLKILEARKQRG